MEFWSSFWNIIWFFVSAFIFIAYLIALFSIITDLSGTASSVAVGKPCGSSP